MFKMGGPVKEGIMDGIKEPRQNYVVGGVKAGLGSWITFIPAALGTAARFT